MRIADLDTATVYEIKDPVQPGVVLSLIPYLREMDPRRVTALGCSEIAPDPDADLGPVAHTVDGLVKASLPAIRNARVSIEAVGSGANLDAGFRLVLLAQSTEHALRQVLRMRTPGAVLPADEAVVERLRESATALWRRLIETGSGA